MMITKSYRVEMFLSSFINYITSFKHEMTFETAIAVVKINIPLKMSLLQRIMHLLRLCTDLTVPGREQEGN